MRIAYFSPFNPLKSGVSDFSEELVFELKKHMDVDIFVDNYKLSNKAIINEFKIYNFDDIKKMEIRNQYDLLVYHVGNNAEGHENIVKILEEYPGICELHDISLHNFLAASTLVKNDVEAYKEVMRYCHGKKGENTANLFLEGRIPAPWENESMEFTVNKHIIDKSIAVIVHSDMAKQMVKGVNSRVPVANIPLHTVISSENIEEEKRRCRQKIGIDSGTLVFASFGFASRNKRILQILEALALCKNKISKDFVYYIVGKVQGIDVETRAQELNISKNVKVTGFVGLEEFNSYMGACDIAFNLRYPTNGESSASLHRLLGMGKPTIVTKIGSFEEYPDDLVYKVGYGENEIDDIANAVYEITHSKYGMLAQSEKIKNFAKEFYDIKLNVLRYTKFFETIVNNNYEEEPLEKLIDILFELDFLDERYIDHVIELTSPIEKKN